MENSSSYVALEAMLKQGWLFMSAAELERALHLLEQKGLISPAERKALTELAQHFGIGQRCDG
jgi:hypothetical protein